jgi:hypothetical protein
MLKQCEGDSLEREANAAIVGRKGNKYLSNLANVRKLVRVSDRF